MRIFLAGTSLLPGYGGPAYSVARLATALAQAGAEVGLWTADQSVASVPLMPSHARVRRLTGGAAEALRAFGAVAVLHDNGIWLRHNHRLAVLSQEHGIPRVVSPRGMLEPWAAAHKRLKKTAAWWLYQRRDLTHARLFHTTAVREAGHLERLELGVPVSVIPNGVDLPVIASPTQCAAPASRQDAARVALFLGRIYPVKGLPMLVEAWARVRPAGWHLQIAGPDEAGHRAAVERLVAGVGLGEVVDFLGLVEGAAKSATFAKAELLVLPSHSESFGMVVAEALAHGLPVLTTTAAPWPGLTERGCGWSVSPSVDGIVQGLREATRQPPATLRAMGTRGRAWMAADFGWPSVASRFLSLYEQALARAV
jgi:glycosyltransferase involved in cell wall biosynthesis